MAIIGGRVGRAVPGFVAMDPGIMPMIGTRAESDTIVNDSIYLWGEVDEDGMGN